jgi:TonB family protein
MNPFGLVLASALKATVILAAAYACAAMLKQASAASRHLVWTAAIAATLLLPVLAAVLPGWRVAVPPRVATELTVRPSQPAGPAAAAHPIPARRSTADWLLVVWAVGCGVVLARALAATVRVWWMVRHSREENEPMLATLASQLGLRRPVRLLTCAPAAMPVTWGIWRPVILLPASAAEWPAERRRLVLLHELVHVARRDHWMQLLTQIVCAGYWFHPLVWHAAGRLRQEREQSCDDAVLRLGTKGSAYAEHLLALARSLQAGQEVWTMAVGMAHASHLESRLLALLDPRRNRQGVSLRKALAAGLVAAGLTLPLAMIGARAQGGAALSGTIFDPSGGTVPQATVTVTKSDGAVKEATRSDDVGHWAFAALPAGRYSIEIARPGFRLFRKTSDVPATSSVMTILEVGAVSESLDVVGKRPQFPPPPSSGRQRIRVGGNVQATKLVNMVRPVYPDSAQQRGVEGTVLLRAVIFTDGTLGSLEVVNKQVDADLAAAATDAVRQWRYEPTLLNGQPVEVVTTITVNFRLGE